MKIAEQILQQLEFCIANNEFRKLENENIELKDNSHSGTEWNELYKTICAFLNTNGGMIITGIREDDKNKKYTITGYNPDQANESKIIDIKTGYKFTDRGKNRFNADPYINFETKDFLEKKVLIIHVDPLADDEKYTFFNGEAYRRTLSGDEKIKPAQLDAQEEYKLELVNSRELKIVPNSSLNDLDVDKLNDYIHLLNSEMKVHNIKTSIEDSLTFLSDRFMIRDNKPTILGMLVCGRDPESKLHWASEVNAYVESGGSERVAQNKKIINGTIIELMEQSFAFVARNIQTGISIEKAGTKTFEYPEKLLRECINNSLAHRDYTIDSFVSINIVPGQWIQIRNPGRFKPQLLITDLEHEIPIRRIVAGNPKANNPKLAKVLSVFNKYEGKGYGIATVVGACLEDKIDVPYYIFHSPDELSLFIPSGKLIDETMETLFTSYDGYISEQLEGNVINEDQKRIISYLYKSEQLNKQDRFTILLTKDNNHLSAIQSLQDAGLIKRHRISDVINTVFILDSKLFRKSFYRELLDIFGNRFKELPPEYRDVLAYIYERNNFSSDKFPSANDVGSKLWIKKGNAHTLEGFEGYKRKVRDIINKLEKGSFLVKKDQKHQYIVNVHFTNDTEHTLL